MSAGYDTSCTTLSQEGRIYQLEYSEKAIENSPTVAGLILNDGVILVAEKIRQSKAIVSGSNPAIYSVTPNIGIAICGLLPDGRNIVTRAKLEASNYWKTYGIAISGQILTERLAIYVHAHTCHWGARPFGCTVLISSSENSKYHLYMLETTGNFFEYYSCAHGKGRQLVKAEIEKDNFAIRNKSVSDGLYDLMCIMLKSYEGEKDIEYDVCAITNETQGRVNVVNTQKIKDIIKEQKEKIEASKMSVDK